MESNVDEARESALLCFSMQHIPTQSHAKSSIRAFWELLSIFLYPLRLRISCRAAVCVVVSPTISIYCTSSVGSPQQWDNMAYSVSSSLVPLMCTKSLVSGPALLHRSRGRPSDAWYLPTYSAQKIDQRTRQER